jgi:ferredoxin
MIVAERKSLNEISQSVRPYKKLLIAACGTCVTVCMAGGEKEAHELSSLLKLIDELEDIEICVRTIQRQCDREFIFELDEDIRSADAVLSMGCGAGVQFLAECYPDKQVIPALNTKFIGVNRDVGYWTEVCQGCGDCILEKTGGICPVARCSKSIFNGPCGGSSGGHCEIDPDIDCAWQLIYDRLAAQGRLERLLETIPPRDWSSNRDGGPRSIRKGSMSPEVEK